MVHTVQEKGHLMSTERGAVPQKLLVLAKAAAAPQLTGAALDRRFGPRSTWLPATGQLWRAAREDVTAVVVLLAVEAGSVTVVPVTVEPSDTADTVLLDDTVLGVPVTVWVGLVRALPVGVLDRPLDEFAAEIVARLAERAADPPGPDVVADDVRAELEDDLTLLAELPPTTAATPVSADAPGIDLETLDPAALDEAAARLAVPLPIVLDLIDGKRPPTTAQADVLRGVLGATPEATPPPADLVVELSQPRWRGLVRQQRRRTGPTEDAARSALAYDIYRMAARQTGGAEPSWPDRIRRWAQAHQLDPDADA